MLQRLLCLMFCLSLLPFSSPRPMMPSPRSRNCCRKAFPKTESPENQQLRESYQQALQYARDAQRYREQGARPTSRSSSTTPRSRPGSRRAAQLPAPVPSPSPLKGGDALRQAISLSSNRQINLRKERQG